MSPADTPLVRAIGRLPAKVHTKLLVAFLATALLVVVVGLLGLRVLGQSNERVETIRTLQTHAVAYGQLQSDVLRVRLLLAENVAGGFDVANNPEAATQTGGEMLGVDQAIASAVARIAPATTASRLGFTPPAEDVELLGLIARAEHAARGTMARIVASDKLDETIHDQLDLRNEAEQLAIDLNQFAGELTNDTTADAEALIAENANAYTASRDLFVAVATMAIVLALILGFALSWSLIGPIQRIETRLAGIASGDFSAHVDVTNRDELGRSPPT